MLIFCNQKRTLLLLTTVFSICLNLYRILPVALVSSDLGINFQSGFTSSGDLLSGMVLLHPVSASLDSITSLNPLIAWWEFDHYMGWIGVAFIVLFCFWLGWKRRADFGHSYLPLWGILGILIVFSIGRIYQVVFTLGIPLLTGERVSSRFFILPLLFLVALAAIGFQKWLNEHPVTVGLGLSWIGGFLILTNDLTQHLELWSVNQLGSLFPQGEVNLFHLANRHDPPYITTLILGLILSLISLVILKVLTRKKNIQPK